MKFPKFIQKHIPIILICFVSPCYQLVNENVKSTNNNDIGNNINQVANANNVNKIVATRRLPLKPVITPQPLITRRKVSINPTNSAKLQVIASNKTPIGVIVRKEATPQKDADQNKNIKTNVDPQPKIEEKPQFFEDQDFDDLDIKPNNDNIDKPKPTSSIKPENKSDETVSQTNRVSPNCCEKIHEKIIENKPVEKKVESHGLLIASNSTKEIVEKESASGNIKTKLAPELEIQNQGKPNKTATIPPSIELKISAKENYFPNRGKSVGENDHVKPINGFESKNGFRNLQKHNLVYHDNIPSGTRSTTNKLQLNIDPKMMEQLTNDANDKIFIKNCNFEELREQYNPSFKDISKSDIIDQNNDPFEQNANIFEDDDYINILNSNSYLKNQERSIPNDRIWRKWKNTEIHIKSNDGNNAEPNIKEEPKRDICNCYNNNNFNPVEYTPNNFEPDKYDNLYTSIIQKPSSYYATSYPSCYQPRSYGYQYAPVSRYQNYLFPCLQ